MVSVKTDLSRTLRLRARLGFVVSGLVAAGVGLTALASLALVEQALWRDFEDRLDSRRREIDGRLRAVRNGVEDALERLSRVLAQPQSPLLERMLDENLREDPEVVLAAAWMRELSGLDLLEVLDDGGIVVSAHPRSERAGTLDEAALAAAGSEAAWVLESVGEEPRLTLIARRTMTVGRRGILLVGGETLDVASFESAADETIEVVPAVPPRPTGDAASEPETVPKRGGEPDRRNVRTVPLAGASGEAVARLEIVASHLSLRARLARARGVFLVLGVGGAIVGALVGWWAGRLASRPMRETVRAIEAVVAGDADYGFSRGLQSELEELPKAFSKLHRKLEEQQRRRAAAERVAAWREVARRVAHEVKNPLVPIRVTIENLRKARRRAPDMFDDIFEEGSSAILEEVDQLQRIVTEFSEYTRLPEPSPSPVDLDELVDSVTALYSGAGNLRLVRRRADEALHVRIDAGLVSRALKNVTGNAVEAIGDAGGTLTVETGTDGTNARVTVRDTGPGFSAEALEHLFQPYFTTKDSGTGLGLAIANRIVADHGGFLTASNLAEGGAEVVMEFPLAGPDARGEERPPRSESTEAAS